MTILRIHGEIDLPAAIEAMQGLGAQVVFEVGPQIRADHLRTALSTLGLRVLPPSPDGAINAMAAQPGAADLCPVPGCKHLGIYSRNIRGTGPFYCVRHWRG